MEGVEDMPGVALNEGVSWDWRAFQNILIQLEKIITPWILAQ